MIPATKWLEQGKFVWPPIRDGAMQMSSQEFSLLLAGIDRTRVKRNAVERPTNDDVAPVAEEQKPERRSPSRNIGRLPRHLPRYEEVIEPESKICPCCSFELHCIGTDAREALDIVPAIVRVKRSIRPRYAAGPVKASLCKRPRRRA